MNVDLSEPGLCLALVSREGAVLEAFRDFFETCGVSIFHAQSISELFRTLPETRVSGIVADIPIIVRASTNEKILFEGIEGIFPNVRVNWSPQSGFKVLFADPQRSGEENLKDFLYRCRAFTPRSLRKNDRKDRNFNVLLWAEDAERCSAIRAFTMDISRGGVFVSTCHPPEVGSTVWVALLELSPEPFKVSVRWNRVWGETMGVPGFGGRFIEVSEEQKESLTEILL